ncbi:hypothetical protein B0J17DRAFT_661661 [Rhizoctonia solani]|nr:hypothetical protein B0J17DRAFT_661661 [Rhizoctonia solani]
MHRAPVPDTHIPPGFEVIGTNPACSDQGVVLRYPKAKDNIGYGGIHVFTLQGHSEFHESITSKIVDARELDGRMNSSVATDDLRRAPWHLCYRAGDVGDPWRQLDWVQSL